MMFGTREPFEYLECGQCGTLQLIDVPDLARHYPIEYFSFDTTRENILGTSLRRRVAVRLGVPLGTVATWVTRGRKAMAEALEDELVDKRGNA